MNYTCVKIDESVYTYFKRFPQINVVRFQQKETLLRLFFLSLTKKKKIA